MPDFGPKQTERVPKMELKMLATIDVLSKGPDIIDLKGVAC
jgi:hypothetical protein